MSPDEPMVTFDEKQNKHALNAVRIASTINLLVGIWFFVSPWVYGAYTNINAWNSWCIGVLIMILAWIRLAYPSTMPGLSWFNAVLGVYAFISPWLYAYTGNTGRFINSLCVGVVVFVAAICSARATSHTLTHRATAHRL
jgi:hypothetical protein